MRLRPLPLVLGLALLPALTSHAGSPAPTPTAIGRVLPIADNAYAGSSVNVVANIRSALFTHSRTQYAAFYATDGEMVLARRTIGTDTWETRRTGHRGQVADAHNAISLAVDGAGFLHVAWDHHNGALNYARSVAPGSLELGAKSPMTGQREASVTYPQFHRLPNGDLLFLYRDGSSGRGSLILNRYSVETQQWSAVQPNLIDGEGRRSPYWSMAVDSRGQLHLAWTWRDSPDVATNHDLAYARSADGGVTWTRVDGTPLALPITAATADYALRIPTGSNLMNPPVVAANRSGRPYICSYWSAQPDAAPQFNIVHHDGKAWNVIAGPARTEAFTLAGTGTKRPPISRAALLVDPTWQAAALHLVYRDDARGGRVVVATLRSGQTDWHVRDLTSTSVGAWEPSEDPPAWERFTQAHFLTQFVEQRDGDDRHASSAEAAIASLIWSPAIDRMRGGAGHAEATPPVNLERALDAAAILRLGQSAVDWQWANFPAPDKRDPRDWVIAPFYIGALALDRVSPDRHNRERVKAQAEKMGWQPHDRKYFADDHCVIQPYLELYREDRDPRMLAPSQARFDSILAEPTKAVFDWGTPDCLDHWSWCDALFMGPMSWLLMYEVTGDARYLEFANRNWWITTDRLYSEKDHLYARDESYLDLREPNGKSIYWSRGDGWVYAGLARVLDHFPKDHADYPRYQQLYREMTAAILAAQQPDGLWRPGLLDPAAHDVRETSGSSFYAYGLAWGLNRGLLDRAQVEPAVRRAWNALASCVTPEGKLEHVQPIGAAPQGFSPRHTEPFGVGAFVLAASEVYQLAGGRAK